MTRQTRLMVLALVALFVAPLALSPFAQSAHSTAAVAGGGRVRDLGVATPESVGVSTERVRRIETGDVGIDIPDGRLRPVS